MTKFYTRAMLSCSLISSLYASETALVRVEAKPKSYAAVAAAKSVDPNKDRLKQEVAELLQKPHRSANDYYELANRESVLAKLCTAGGREAIIYELQSVQHKKTAQEEEKKQPENRRADLARRLTNLEGVPTTVATSRERLQLLTALRATYDEGSNSYRRHTTSIAKLTTNIEIMELEGKVALEKEKEDWENALEHAQQLQALHEPSSKKYAEYGNTVTIIERHLVIQHAVGLYRHQKTIFEELNKPFPVAIRIGLLKNLASVMQQLREDFPEEEDIYSSDRERFAQKAEHLTTEAERQERITMLEKELSTVTAQGDFAKAAEVLGQLKHCYSSDQPEYVHYNTSLEETMAFVKKRNEQELQFAALRSSYATQQGKLNDAEKLKLLEDLARSAYDLKESFEKADPQYKEYVAEFKRAKERQLPLIMDSKKRQEIVREIAYA